ncbi:MAG: hypothetical protein HZA78_01340 [Candidatus Schekmanbacteria bacterium]|nr:hypothetical protein [Candidatus Schekmanbacteria bacterium]
MPFTNIDLFSILGSLGGFTLIYYGSKRLKLKRLIEDTPTSRLKSMSIGLVEVKGQVRPAFQIETPFNHTPCCYYRYRVQEYRRNSKGRGHWVVILEGDSHQYSFFLEDESGAALILPKNAEFDLAWNKVYESGSMLSAPPPHIVEFLLTKDIKVQGWIFSKTIKVEEAHLFENQPLYILGYANSWKLGKDSGEAKQIKYFIWNKELVNLKKDMKRLFREFDLNKDGKIDADEWEIAKKKMAEKAKEKFQAQMHNLMQIEHGPKGGIFYISEKSEAELLSRFGKSSFFSILGGAVLSIGGIVWFLYRFFV